MLRNVLRFNIRNVLGVSPTTVGYVELIGPSFLHPSITFTRASTAEYYGSDMLIKVAAVDEPRYDSSPVDGSPRGLLLEGARTNLVLRSTLQGGGAAPTGWGRPIGTGTSAPAASSSYGNADSAVAYDQEATAQRPFISTIATISTSANTTYTFSVIVEAVTGTVRAQDLVRYAALPAGATVSYPVCPANPAGGATGVIVPGRLMVQISIAGTAGSSSGYFGLGVNGNVTGTLRFSRPQVEAGTGVSSFIPTTTAAITRQGDLATINDLSDIDFDPTKGTLYVEARAPSTVANAATLASFNDGTANEVIRLHMNAGGSLRAQVIDGGITVADLALGTLSAGQSFTAAMTYTVNDIKGSLDGATVQTDSSATIPTVDRLMIGRGTAGDAWFGHVSVLRYYPMIRDTQEVTL